MTCNWDIGARGTGKTARMIQRASEENAYIIVANRQRADEINKMAHAMNLNILNPITVKELPIKLHTNMYCKTHDGVLVDDAEYMIGANLRIETE